ncbi:glycosyltransferase [Teredinibacter waterburyi]|jgi:Glycosyltransferase|uniref:glycosyltransferase n=1 Tax=Teredinibacter waterburyi TaxID=1500538 RepID=UPI00165FB287|nr:glycosyltransferase [Teredinibacter waterburyi]
MKICYFVNQYPKVSHTFIRREILALETLGVEVVRIAARNTPAELVDPLDQQEMEKTRCIATGSKAALISSALLVAVSSPLFFFRALIASVKLALNDRNRFVSYCIYLIEACLLQRICKKENIQHIHAHFATNSATVAMLVKLLGGPSYSFTVHGPEEFDKPLQISLSEKISSAAFVVAITSYCTSQLYRWCEFADWNKMLEVHCAVDPELLAKPRLPITSNTHFVSIGRLCEQKGQMLLLAAIAQLKRKGVNIQLDLIGDGELRPEIEAFILANDLSTSVKLLGWQSTAQIVDTLDRSCALLLPSFAEGLPVVIMESYARARPVLSTYIAGIPELIDADNGWLVAAGNVDALAAKIELITETPLDVISNLGSVGFERVSARHNSLTEANKLAEKFAEVIA